MVEGDPYEMRSWSDGLSQAGRIELMDWQLYNYYLERTPIKFIYNICPTILGALIAAVVENL